MLFLRSTSKLNSSFTNVNCGFNFSSAEQLAEEVHHLYQNRAQLNVMAERTKKFFDAHCDAATIYRTYSDWVELLEKDFRECTFNLTDL